MLFNVTIDECGDVTGCGAGLVGGLRNGQLVQQVIEHLDGFLVLGLGVCCIRGYRIHNVDRGHCDGLETEMSVDGVFQGLKTGWKNLVQLKTNRVSHSESPRGSALYAGSRSMQGKKVYRETTTMSMSGRQKREWSG